MSKCQSFTSNGKQCRHQASRKLGHNELFCWQHQTGGQTKAQYEKNDRTLIDASTKGDLENVKNVLKPAFFSKKIEVDDFAKNQALEGDSNKRHTEIVKELLKV